MLAYVAAPLCLLAGSRPSVVRRAVPPAAQAQAGIQQLDSDAKALYDEMGGDAIKARTSYIGYTLAYIKDEMPELYEKIKNDPKEEEAHAALVELTWDAIAAFLPVTHSPTPPPESQKRLAVIARAGCDPSQPADATTLDVGCGTGLLLPYVGASGAPIEKYRGVDLSGRMIEVAKATHAEGKYEGAAFDDVSFKEVVAEGGSYDSIFFNGALQFFADPTATIADAAKLLKPGPTSRLVVSHLNGAAFVRKEREENPTTVLSAMPSLAELEQTAATLGLQVALPSFLGTETADIERNLDDFYIAILRWDAEHGGVDGATGVATGEDEPAAEE